jgi:hypothetical protein
MTRVTNDLRGALELAIMKDLPSRDYAKEIHALVQEVVIVHASEKVRVMYDDPDLRDYLAQHTLDVRRGNQSVPMYKSGEGWQYVYGLKDMLKVRMDDAENAGRLPEGSLYRDIVTKLHKAGLVDAYFAQEDLRGSVRQRLRANLRASGTFKQLYANLEPELHHYIPKDEVKAQVPACVAPVVDDLRKLGAVLPSVPKVEDN